MKNKNSKFFILFILVFLSISELSFSQKPVDGEVLMADTIFNDLPYNKQGYAKYNLGQKQGACLDWSKAGELGYEGAYNSIAELCK